MFCSVEVQASSIITTSSVKGKQRQSRLLVCVGKQLSLCAVVGWIYFAAVSQTGCVPYMHAFKSEEPYRRNSGNQVKLLHLENLQTVL